MANNRNNPNFNQGYSGQDMPPRQRPMQGAPGSPSAGRMTQGMANGGRASVAAAAGSKRTVIVALGIVVAAIAIWVCVWLFACNGNSMFDASAQTGQAPYKSAEEIQAELDRVVEEGMFNISIASVVEFADGESAGTAYIENVPGNRYLMQVTITEDDTNEVVYESGVLQPNQFIEDITLSKDLDPGTYSATATFKALDQTTYEEIGQAAAKITLNVLS